MTVVQTRLLAYSPNGASLGQLPTPQEWSASFPRSDVGALTVTYNPKAIQGTLLGQPLEVALEVQKADGTGWVETPNGRFLYLRDGRDPVADDAYQAECPSYGRRLEKAVIPFTGLNSEGMRQFTTSTDGAILHTLLTEAQARDALTGITWTFTATHDSAGWAWGSSRNQAFEPGKNLLAVLQEMASDGRLDWRFQGRELQVYVASTAGPAGSMSVDTTVSANPVTFRAGRDLTDAPFRRTWEGLADTVLVGGDNRVNTTRQNAAALKPWGRQETYVAASGVGDTGTLSILGDLVLQTTSGVRAEHTATLSLADAAHVPLIDYQPGWWVNRAPDGNAAERVRLQQVTLTMDANGTLGGNVVLNDRFLERDVLLQRMVQGIINGTTGGTPTDPTVGVGNDILAPAQVTGLIGSSLAYLDGAIMRAQVSLDWNDVTTNADGSTATDVAEYQVDYRKGTSDPFARMTDVASGTSGVTWSPLTPDTLYQFRVRAVDTVGNEGAWSATYSLTTGKDTTPPAPPSAPVLTARLGVVTVAWDGLNDVGAAMDADLAYVEVHASVTAGFAGTTTTTVVGYLEGKGAAPVAMPYGTVYARLRAVDKSGNKSTPSAIANITNPALVDTDVIGKVLDGAKVLDATIRAEAVAFQVGGGNQVKNGSFELGDTFPDSWGLVTGGLSDTEGWAFSSESRYGTKSLKIQRTEANAVNAYINQSVPVGIGLHTVSAWVKRDSVGGATANQGSGLNIDPGPGTAYTVVRKWGNRPIGGGNAAADWMVQGTNDWQREWVTIDVTAPGTLVLHCQQGYGGNAWGTTRFDGVQVETGDVMTGFSPAPGELAPGSITTTHITDGAIATPKLAANAVSTDKLAANAVTAEKLTVAGLGAALMPNGGFEEPGVWTYNPTASRVTTSPHGGLYHVRLAASGSAGIVGRQFPVGPGDTLSYTAWAKAVSGPTGLYLRVVWYDASGNQLSSPPYTDVLGAANIGSTWARYGGQATAPTGAAFARTDVYNTQGSVDLDDVDVRPVIVSAMIGDGAITTPKVASLAIDTGQLAANAVKADKVDAGAITGTKISGDAIDGKTITGAIIRTTATPSRGVRLDTGGITAWNSSGVQTFRVDATTGAVSLLGDLTAGSTVTGATVQTAASGNRLVIRQDSGAGVIEAFTGDTYEQLPGKIDPTYAATDGGIYSLRLQPGYHATGWATGERPTLVLSSRSRLAGVAGYVGMTAGQISLTGATTVTGAATVTSTLTAQGAGNGLVVSNSALVYGSVQVNGSVATNNISPASGSQVGFGAGTYVNMPGTIKTGTSTVNISAVNTNATANVSFPIAFPAGGPVPTVVLTATGLTGNTVIKLAASAVTRSGFTVNAVRSSGTGNMTVDWLAVAA